MPQNLLPCRLLLLILLAGGLSLYLLTLQVSVSLTKLVIVAAKQMHSFARTCSNCFFFKYSCESSPKALLPDGVPKAVEHYFGEGPYIMVFCNLVRAISGARPPPLLIHVCPHRHTVFTHFFLVVQFFVNVSH